MPDIRVDPLSGTSVIVAAARDDRPHEFEATTIRSADTKCPFCAGNEDETPSALANYDLSGAYTNGDWQVRVVPNKYPAVFADAGEPEPTHEVLSAQPASGLHEVIIESPQHVTSLSQLTCDEATLCFRVYRDRLRAAYASTGVRFAQVFKNVGPQAGASLEHLHSQLMATTFVPQQVATEVRRCEEFFRRDKRPLLDALVEAELNAGERVIVESSNFVAYCPFAGRFPYETWITPHRSSADFYDVADDCLVELAGLAKDIVQRMEDAHDLPAYNMLLRTPPMTSSNAEVTSTAQPWFLTLFPRLTTPAGWEWATGSIINPVPPEIAAQHLRNVNDS